MMIVDHILPCCCAGVLLWIVINVIQVNIFYSPMKTQSTPTTFKFVMILFLFFAVHSNPSCSSNCTANTTNAFCTSQGYCSCLPGFIFSCNVSATTPSSNGYLMPLTNARPYYYIINSQTGTELEYSVTFSDPNIFDIYGTYHPNFLTDEGMTVPPSTTYRNDLCSVKPFSLSCTFKITLSNQPDSPMPQNLVLIINISNPLVTPNLLLSYSYTTHTQSTPIFLILGYVAGGLLILISIVLIVLVYRKKGGNRQRANSKAEPVIFDISYFQQFMPAQLITVDDKKNLQTCSVCLQEFDFNSTVRKTICAHVFHTGCLDEWCIKNLSCPMCRTEFSREKLAEMRVEKSKRESQTDWIMNSMAGDEEPSEIRNPLNGTTSIDNNDL